MWESDLPEVDDHLRQGDLLITQPIPRRGKWVLSIDRFEATAKAGFAVVLERCCSVEQRKTLLLAKVGRAQNQGPEMPLMQALCAEEQVEGMPYAWYEHLLESFEPVMPAVEGEVRIIQLLERLSVAATSHEQLAPFRERRVARMTPLARARLRAKLVGHWGRAENDDLEWLTDNGFDPMGRTVQGQLDIET